MSISWCATTCGATFTTSRRAERVLRIRGVNHLDVVCALEKVGFHIPRLRKHVVMPDDQRIVTTSRHNPVNAFSM